MYMNNKLAIQCFNIDYFYAVDNVLNLQSNKKRTELIQLSDVRITKNIS